jgi:purine catabolism regulator
MAAAEYASVTRTFTAQQALTKAALAASGPDRLVRLLAQQILGWVVLLDPAGAPIAAYPDGARSKVAVLAGEMAVLAAHRGTVSSGFPLDSDTVSLQSVGAGPRGRAFLAVGRPGPLSATDRHLVNAAVMLLTIRLEQTSTMDAGLGMLRAAVLRMFLAGQAELAAPIADQLSLRLPTEPLTVLVATGNVDAVAAELDGSGLPSADRVLVAELDGALVAAVDGGEDAATDVATRLLMSGPDLGSGIAVGISAPTGYADVALALRQARQAADFGHRHGRAVTRFEEIAMPGITGMLPPDAALAFAESLLRPLVEHDLAGRGDLVTSLRAWLTHHGQWDPSATALGVHRHTLRHRMRTVEELLARSLDSPGTRGELWLALTVLDGRDNVPISQ